MEKTTERQRMMMQLKESLQALAVEAKEQLLLFPDFVVKTDELVLDFDDARLCAVGNYRHAMTAAQLKILADIDAHIASPNPSGDRSVWDEAALESHPFWKKLRELAADA